jgi:hypothetical protein
MKREDVKEIVEEEIMHVSFVITKYVVIGGLLFVLGYYLGGGGG